MRGRGPSQTPKFLSPAALSPWLAGRGCVPHQKTQGARARTCFSGWAGRVKSDDFRCTLPRCTESGEIASRFRCALAGIQYESLRGCGGFFQKAPLRSLPLRSPALFPAAFPRPHLISNASRCGGEDHLRRLVTRGRGPSQTPRIAGERTISDAEVPLPRSPLSLAPGGKEWGFASLHQKHRERGRERAFRDGAGRVKSDGFRCTLPRCAASGEMASGFRCA